MNKIIELQDKIIVLASQIWGESFPNQLTKFCKQHDTELSHMTIPLCKKIIKLLGEELNEN